MWLLKFYIDHMRTCGELVLLLILFCGSRPFWAQTESGIFRALLKADPGFGEAPWPSLSPDAIDFVKRLLNKDYRKRLTAAQALSKSLMPCMKGFFWISLYFRLISHDPYAARDKIF